MRKTNQSGASMIEMMGVFAVISVVTIGIIATISKIYDRYQQAAIISEIRDLQKNIRARFASTGDYSQLAFSNAKQMLIADRVIPAKMVSGNKIYHAYNGPVEISGSRYVYKIKFSNIKKSGCVDLLTLDWSVNGTSDLTSIKVNNRTYQWALYKLSPIDLNKDILDSIGNEMSLRGTLSLGDSEKSISIGGNNMTIGDISTGNVSINDTNKQILNTNLPINVIEASKVCDNDRTKNTIEWTFQ